MRKTNLDTLLRRVESRVQYKAEAPQRKYLDAAQSKWFYQDDSGTIQGPFSGAQMNCWKTALPDDLLVRLGPLGQKFTPLNELMGPNGSASDVFLADPRQDILRAIKALEEMQKEIEVSNVEKDLVRRRVSSSWGDMHDDKLEVAEDAGSAVTGNDDGSIKQNGGSHHHTRKSTWIRMHDPNTQHEYFYDQSTGQSQWEAPPHVNL